MKRLIALGLFAAGVAVGAETVYVGPYAYFTAPHYNGAASVNHRVFVIRTVRDLRWVMKHGDDEDLLATFPPTGTVPEDVRQER